MADTKRSYREKLLDGRWQIARLKILERDGFTCQACGARGEDGTTLHVHHRWYERGREPWDAPPEALVTLCCGCHGLETDLRPAADAILQEALRLRFFWDGLPTVAAALDALPVGIPGSDDALTACVLDKERWLAWRRSILDAVLGQFAPED